MRNTALNKEAVMARIVGWHLEPHSDDPCACGQPSTVIVLDNDEVSYYSSCQACVPDGTRDEIAEVLKECFSPQEDTER